MVKQNQSIMALLPLFLILTISAKVKGTKLFVFGDSYVDTGNNPNASSYRSPYGMTYPGTPTGRFGNGRVLTDYIGNFLFSLDCVFGITEMPFFEGIITLL
ncbi:hypothetical protein Lal_00047393 [Lupinus albus]|nr:hypothetical protein Lal_00047393 [Lupinus albus]